MKNNPSRNDKVFDIILEESFDKYATDVANCNVECEMTEAEIQVMESKEKTIYNKLIKNIEVNKKVHISIRKISILVAILLLGVIVVSFGSPVIHTWFQRSNMKMSGTDLNIVTKKYVFEGYNDIKNFENKSAIIIPNWLPEGMELIKLNDDNNFLGFFYKNSTSSNASYVSMSTMYNVETSTETIATENNNYTIEDSVILNMQCKIITLTSETGLVVRTVHWDSGDTSYKLMTNVSEEEFNKILENLVYFEE